MDSVTKSYTYARGIYFVITMRVVLYSVLHFMAYNSNFGCNIRLLLCSDLIDPTIYIHKKVRFPLLEQKRNKDYILYVRHVCERICMNKGFSNIVKPVSGRS